MLEFYPQIKSIHIWLISASGALFALRGSCTLAGMRWPRDAWVRYASYGIDTALLTSAAMLYTMLPRAIFANHWLSVKLVLVAVYIALGISAMRARLPRGRRAMLYASALVVFATIVGIARMHQPLGWLWPYFS